MKYSRNGGVEARDESSRFFINQFPEKPSQNLKKATLREPRRTYVNHKISSGHTVACIKDCDFIIKFINTFVFVALVHSHQYFFY